MKTNSHQIVLENTNYKDMEFWNVRNMLAPATYTYKANGGDIDVNHLKATLQDGVKFFNEQNILNTEVALLSRIVYRMKTKFRNSKDFQTLEKVKKNIKIFQDMDISSKLEYLLTFLPIYDYHQVEISLPTKNMLDFILVQLQGVGKILCKVIETCKLTVIIYEHRLYLGHFWKLALIAIALVSRIHLLCLNMVKYTCILYARLLPFSHHLKNVTINWLPKEYVFPKDLKSWLNVEWSKLQEVIEVPDEEFNLSLIDLAGDSDDDVEYVEISDVADILKDFKKIQKTQVEKLNLDESVILLPPFQSNADADFGEEIGVDLEKDPINEETKVEEIDEAVSPVQNKNEIVEDLPIAEEISSNSKEDPMTSAKFLQREMNEVDFGVIISSDDELIQTEDVLSVPIHRKNEVIRESSSQVVISSSDEDIDGVQFVSKTRKPFMTTDFIPLGTSTVSPVTNRKEKKKLKKNKPARKNTGKEYKNNDSCARRDSNISSNNNILKKSPKRKVSFEGNVNNFTGDNSRKKKK